MEDPRSKLKAALKEAMKNKDASRRGVIRMALNAIKQQEIDSQNDLSAEDATAILQKEAKKRREIVEEMAQAGRDDLAEKEKSELAILEEFLPQQLSREQIQTLAQDVIEQTGASSTKDMGKVMGALMSRVKGQADGKIVNEVVRELLES